VEATEKMTPTEITSSFAVRSLRPLGALGTSRSAPRTAAHSGKRRPSLEKQAKAKDKEPIRGSFNH
jgi:hypothetical protein